MWLIEIKVFKNVSGVCIKEKNVKRKTALSSTWVASTVTVHFFSFVS
jgi:hypothetical protein